MGGYSHRPERPGGLEPRLHRGLRDESGAHILNHMVQYSDRAFAAISDSTRRGILDFLGKRDASITDLADRFDMTLTGMKKHVQILEEAGLVATDKVGRTRTCRLGNQRLDAVTAWILTHQQMVDARLNRLEAFLERTQGDPQ